jgi:GTP1/Obg family GTP-binding protein
MKNSNAEKLFDELEKYYEEIIDQMEDIFTFHQFIKKLSQARQDIYVQVLNEYSENKHPFKSVHSIIAKRLGKFDHLVKYDKWISKSENIFGKKTAQWFGTK